MVLPRALGLVIMTAGAAGAAPLATLATGAGDATLDVDGVVHFPGHGDVKLAPRLIRAQLSGARYQGQDYVVAKITGPGQAEAVILRLDAGRWIELARTPIGGVGLDQDYGLDVTAGPDGIFRYQTRGDVRRCDGAPALVFADKLDGARFRKA
ncbi:MAG TPA: hypothetical protein VGC42_00785, partial [Kofleriaceae bacterium]